LALDRCGHFALRITMTTGQLLSFHRMMFNVLASE
jgi:hypothetical protein